jgi:glycosyltransferase EpsH
MNSKVSIIIPTMNSSTYIRKCLESIEFQDYENIQTIIIDGGSSDATFEIAKEYIGRLKIIMKVVPGSSQGEARNNGVDISTGDYILFLDSDDSFYSKDSVRHMVENIENTSHDFVNYAINFVDENGVIKKKVGPFKVNTLIGDTIFRYALVDKEVYSIPWNKIYRKSFLIGNNICFPDCEMEDMYYSRICAYYASTVGFSDKLVISASVREGSLSRNIKVCNANGLVNIFNMIEDFLKKRHEYKLYYDDYRRFVLKNSSYLIILSSYRTIDDEQYKTILNILFSLSFNKYKIYLHDILHLNILNYFILLLLKWKYPLFIMRKLRNIIHIAGY